MEIHPNIFLVLSCFILTVSPEVCLFGLSLIKEDIEWFENEECDETRIRTIEPFEVENRQIQLKEVTRREGGYTFDMHVMRGRDD